MTATGTACAKKSIKFFQSRCMLASGTKGSALLDGLRALAALLVCFEHVRNLFFVDFTSVAAHRQLFAAIYMICGAGHQAVVIFFVLSGFLVGSSALRAVEDCKWSWSSYLTRRLTRLWVVLLPALALGAFWDKLGLHLHQAPRLYGGLITNLVTKNIQQALTPSVFVGNCVFLQTIRFPTFGSNGALWSLANEFWYYLLFPVVLCALSSIYKTGTRVIYALLFLLMCWFVGKAILVEFPVWLMGACLYVAPTRKVRASTQIQVCCFYAILFFAAAAFEHHRNTFGHLHVAQYISDYAVGLASVGLIWVLAQNRKIAEDTYTLRLSRKTAHISYTLYVSHLPFAFFMAAVLFRDVRLQPNLSTLAMTSVVMLLIISYAFVLASVTEFKTDKVRRWLEPAIYAQRCKIGQFLAAKRKAV